MKTLIFDGHNACWRVMKAVPELTSNGKPIQVVFGFLKLLRHVVDMYNPNRVVVAWDSPKGKNIRREMFSGYKASREEHKKDLEFRKELNSMIVQVDSLRNLIGLLGVAQVRIPYLEGDDTVALLCSVIKGRKIIVSNDRDLFQLIRQDVYIYSPTKAKLYFLDNFKKDYGMAPAQYLEMRVLAGDKSDEIPGVAAGFGEKTAKELILKYGLKRLVYDKQARREITRGMSKRHALLYSSSDYAGIIARNLDLMDLSRVMSNYEAGEYASKRLEEVSGLDRAELKQYFVKHQFVSLLKDFGRWVTPFEGLK